MWDLPQHTYEEIREVVIAIILKQENVAYDPNQFGHLVSGVAEVFARRATPTGQPVSRHNQPRAHPYDAELVRDVFWDLFRQGFITLGLNDSNSAWPFFRISHFGQKTLAIQSPYRFHDTSSFIGLVKKEIPDLLPEAAAYLDEAVAAFYAGCLLATCVMLGVAAEAEFLRLIDVAAGSATHGTTFAPAQKPSFVRQKITKFQNCIKPILPSLPAKIVEDFDANVTTIQSVLRIARNEAGHPSAAAPPEREQVYVYLQLFVPFARQLMKLRQVLA